MRNVSPEWPTTIARGHQLVTELTSWRDGVQLGATMLPEGGELTFDATARSERRCQLTFPSTVGVPTDPDHPLAAYGQRLNIRTGVVHPVSGTVELLDMGWYLITDWAWSEADDIITVEAESLRRVLDGARLWYPTSAFGVAGGNLAYASQFTALASGLYQAAGQGLTTSYDPALAALTVASDRLYSRDRTAEMDQLAREWGAQWRVNDAGVIRVSPVPGPLSSTTAAQIVLTDGTNGTVVDRAAAGSRARVSNVVIVEGGAPPGGGRASVGIAYWTDAPDAPSPVRWNGPYGQEVTEESNEALTTDAAVNAFARSRLPQLVRPAIEHPLQVLPDPSWQLDDVVRVEMETGTVLGRVGSFRLPLTAADGVMTATLVAGDYGIAV